MNEIAIRQFVEETEAYLHQNRSVLEPDELQSVSELYDDLIDELERQQLFDELYR